MVKFDSRETCVFLAMAYSVPCRIYWPKRLKMIKCIYLYSQLITIVCAGKITLHD